MMKYTLEQKAQIMALQNPDSTYLCEYENYVLLTDRHIGYYIKKSDLILNIDKVKRPSTTSSAVDPCELFKVTTEAKKTRSIHMLSYNRMAIKLKSDDGKKAWIDMNYLKQFGDNVCYRISTEKEPILISNYRGVPVGIVMPMFVPDEE